MGGTNGISGSGNNFNVRGDLKNLKLPSGLTVETTQSLSKTPLLSLNTVNREELGFVNPYSHADATITSAREIASSTNDIMAKLGYPNFKVTPKTVASISEGLNGTTLPALNTADDNAVAARVATPKGPFAELFT